MVALIGLASGQTCVSDNQCLTNAYFCYEENSSVVGSHYYAQCSAIPDTTECNQSISCTVNSDCTGIGTGICDTEYGICISNSDVGESCLLDIDCGSGNYCRLGICTPSASPYSCTSEICASGQTCVNTVCRAIGSLGADCDKNTDCQSGFCEDTYNICAECDSGNIYDAPEGYFCNIQGSVSCSLNDNFVETWAYKHGYNVPIWEAVRDEGDACFDNGCCASNVCKDEKCALAQYGAIGAISSDYCPLGTGTDLTTEYIDGIANTSAPPNLTFFADLFDTGNLTYFTNLNGTTRGNDSDFFWFRGTLSGEPRMTAWFVDITNDDLCYFRQLGIEVLWVCHALGTVTIDVGLSNATHSFIIEPFTLNDYAETDGQKWGMYSASMGVDHDESGIAVLAYDMTTTTMRVDAHVWEQVSVNSNAYIFTIYGSPSFFYGDDFTKILNNHGTLLVAHDEWERDNETQYRLSLTVDMEVTLDQSPYTQFAFGAGIADNGSVDFHSPWTATKMTGEPDTEEIRCCNDATDCPDGWLCDPVANACYYDDTTEDLTDLTLTFASASPALWTDTLCLNTTYSFQYWLTVNNSMVYPDGEITVDEDLDGTGTMIGSPCNANDAPCTFTYTTPVLATTIQFDALYEGDAENDPIFMKRVYTVSSLCGVIKFHLYDPINNVNVQAVTTDMGANGGSKSTDVNGLVLFNGLNVTDTNVTISKTGYYTSVYLIDETEFNLPTPIELLITPSGYLEGTGLISSAIPSNITIPTNSSELIGGIKEISFAFIVYPFQMIILLVLFLMGLGIIKLLLKSVI